MDTTFRGAPVAALDTDTRADFILRTYMHLMGAILLFVAIEYALFASGVAYSLANAMLGGSWLLVLGGFVVVSWFASRAAMTAESKVAQYAALGGFVLAESIIFVPMLAIAMSMTGDLTLINNAAWVTILGLAGLTAVAFWTRKDFSFLGGMLKWAFILALVGIVSAVLFGFELGTWFSLAMIGLAGAAILYDTSNVLHHFPEDRYVAASLQLFSSVALMFWYVLRLFMSRDNPSRSDGLWRPGSVSARAALHLDLRAGGRQRVHPAEVVDLGVAQPFQDARRLARADARGAVDVDRLVGGQAARACSRKSDAETSRLMAPRRWLASYSRGERTSSRVWPGS